MTGKLTAEAINFFKASPATKNNAGSTGGQNAIYGSIDTAGIFKYNSYPCHAYMKHYSNSTVIVSKYITSKSTAKIRERYLQFLKTGPWKGLWDRFEYDEELQSFVNPHVDKTPANYQHNFLVASRAISEWSYQILSWDMLVNEYKIHPAVAFWFAGLFITDQYHSTFPEKTAPAPILRKNLFYDWCLDYATYPVDSFEKFIKGKPSNFNQMFAESPSYTPVNEIWGKVGKRRNGTINYSETYPAFLQTTYSKWYGKLVPNTSIYTSEPFMSTHWQLTFDEIIQIIQAEQKRIGF